MKSDELLSLPALAAALKLPEQWLAGEADAGRLPHLRVDGPYRRKRYRFSLRAVKTELARRAAHEGKAVARVR